MIDSLLNLDNWHVLVATVAVVMLCVGVHYEVLSNCNRLLQHLGRRHRRRIFVLILFILVAHLVEMWLFTFGYYYLIEWQHLGELAGMSTGNISDYAYYSAMVYTTVGFGDLVPLGPIRLLTGMEALTGLVMITWSASFTFLEMQRYWRPE